MFITMLFNLFIVSLLVSTHLIIAQSLVNSIGASILCSHDKFRCSTGLCIPLEWTCDKDSDCADGSDETEVLCENKRNRRVCYFTNWAQYREGKARFTPSHVRPELCSHIIYAFAKLEGTKLTTSEWNDPQMYEQFNDLKKVSKGLKTLLAVGGWNAASKDFSPLVATPEGRQIFALSAIDFLRKYGFDGLDLDWEYPTRRGGNPEDRHRFALFVKELREAFERESIKSRKPRLLLSAAVPAGKEVVESGYDVAEIAKHLDFINLMSYDFHGGWEDTVGHNSPLYPRSTETEMQKTMNTDWAARNWVQKGTPKDKINIGIATYGRSFILSNPSQSYKMGASAVSPASPGRYTRETGFLSYYEVCQMMSEGGGKVYRDLEQNVPYYVKGRLWIGFDDETSVREKAEYIVREGYGGSMIWSLSLDDFDKICPTTTQSFPLTSAIHKALTKADTAHILPTTPARKTTTLKPTTEPMTFRPPGFIVTTEDTGVLSNKDKIISSGDDSVVGGGGSIVMGGDGMTAFHTTMDDGSIVIPTRQTTQMPPIPVVKTTEKPTTTTTRRTTTKTTPVTTTTAAPTTTPKPIPTTTKPPTTQRPTKRFDIVFSTRPPVVHKATIIIPYVTRQPLRPIQPQITYTTKRPKPITKRPTMVITKTSPKPIKPTNPQIPTNLFMRPVFPTYFNCRKKPFGYYQDVKDCEKYFVCHQGRTFHYKCPSNLLFNVKITACDWESVVDCKVKM